MRFSTMQEAQTQSLFRSDRNGAPGFCFDAFSYREPVSTSLENALIAPGARATIVALEEFDDLPLTGRQHANQLQPAAARTWLAPAPRQRGRIGGQVQHVDLHKVRTSRSIESLAGGP